MTLGNKDTTIFFDAVVVRRARPAAHQNHGGADAAAGVHAAL
jgi:hypothetical protein